MSQSSTEFINKMVRAGAGAGKTHDLIEKIFRIIFEYAELNQGKLPQIVVCTFTRKATQEIKERLLKKAFQLQSEGDSRADKALQFLSKSNLLHVSTIHGVLLLYLRKYGHLMKLDSDLKLIESHECEFARKQLFNQILKSEDQSAKDIFKLWKWDDINYFSEKFRMAKALNHNLRPLNSKSICSELLFEFENIKKELTLLLNVFERYRDTKKESAVNKFCDALKIFLDFIKKNNIAIPLHSNDIHNQLLQAYEKIPQKLGAMKNIDEETKELKKLIHEKVTKFLDCPFVTKNMLDLFQNQMDTEAKFLDDFNNQVQQFKIAMGELSNSDLEIFSLNLVHEFPQSAMEFSQEWHYWFIDEFQDTSPSQVALLKKLIGDKNYYLVGDPQQSIYFFRGARSEIFKKEWFHFLNHGYETEHKIINRRSDAKLLAWINSFITHLNSEQFSPMDHLDGIENYKLLNSTQVELSDILSIKFYEKSESVIQDNELEFIGEQIKQLSSRGFDYSQMAILCRENSEIEKIINYLRSVDIPVQNFSKGKFFESGEVQKLLSFYNFLLNPFDDLNLINVLRNINDVTEVEIELIKLTNNKISNKYCSLWNTVVKNPLVITSGECLLRFIKKSNSYGCLNTWIEMLTNFGFLENDQTLVWQLYHHLSTTVDHHKIIEMGSLPQLKESNSIKIMTIHASKGLEFDHVFLPYLEKKIKKDGPDIFMIQDEQNIYVSPLKIEATGENNYPPYSYKIKDEEFQQLQLEQERLIYVAVTRAKKSLHFLIENIEDENRPWVQFLKRISET